jgi:hypothetical protein
MRFVISLLVLVGCVVTAHAQDAAPAQPKAAAQAAITHVPLNEAWIGDAKLAFEVRDAQLAGTIVVHVLGKGAGKSAAVPIEALRGTHAYEARIPAELVQPPSFSYFVTERMPDGSERPVFADRQGPHSVRVTRPREQEDELARLAARGGQRSTVTLAADVIDFGDRKLGSGGEVHDRYYRLEAGYAYSFLTRIETIQLSIVRVRGQGATWSATWSEAEPPNVDATSPGIDYGRAEVTVLATEEVRVRGALLLGASQSGFEYGGGGSVVIGDARSMSLELGVERITTLGTTGHLRLGFAALPRVPMGAAIEISSFPTGDDSGVRLLYDVGYRFGEITQLTLRAGYQGRTSVTGGPAFGATFDYGF